MFIFLVSVYHIADFSLRYLQSEFYYVVVETVALWGVFSSVFCPCDHFSLFKTIFCLLIYCNNKQEEIRVERNEWVA